MDFPSDKEDENGSTSSGSSPVPAALRTNQSAEAQPSDTESGEFNQTRSLSTHAQTPGLIPEISYAQNGAGTSRANNSMESSIRSDVIRVDITDFDGNESINLTTTTLKKCKESVLRPYWRLLMFIAWRGFGRESINPNKWYWRLLNTVYFILLLMLLLYSYIYEVIACEWKLNVSADVLRPAIQLTTTPETTTANSSALNVTQSIPWSNMSLSHMLPPATNNNIADMNVSRSRICEHVITTYVIPNILHFIAYIIGFIYFRIMENEQLYALMEKVFLQASPLQGRLVSQSNMIRKLRLYLGLGAAWVFLTVILQVLYVIAFGVEEVKVYDISVRLFWFMFSLQLLGILLTSAISIAVVINYASQCEILIFFINGIQLRIQEKTGDLKSMMKDILAVRQSLGQLNGPMSRMTSLMVITFAEMVVIGITILIINEYDDTMIWVYRGFFPCVWSIMLLFPLIQAARTNSTCTKFKRIALETRVFGYQNSSLLELDSFLLFVSNARLQAKLFHIQVKPSYLAGGIVIISFVTIVLLHSGVVIRNGVPLWM